MEEANDSLSIAKLFDLKGKMKKKNKKRKAKKEGNTVAVDSVEAANNGGGGVRISLFDFSVENFFRDMDTIARLCGEEERHATLEDSEIQRMSSSITFLRYGGEEELTV